MRIAALLTVAILPLSACAASDNDTAESSSTVTTSPTAESAASDVKPLPFNASGMLGGNAQPNFADGEPGKVSVVQVGPLSTDQGILLFAFRNNTSKGISHVEWTATARSGGNIVATGSSQGTTPVQVQPGEVGLSYIYFDSSEAIPAGVEYTFTVETSPVDTDSFNTAPLKVTEASISGDAIVGSATNQTGETTDGPFRVDVYCFEGDNLLRYTSSYTEQDGPINDGGTVTFSVDLYGDECASFAVGVGGYFS